MFMKIRPVGAELYRMDGRTGVTDVTKLIVVFRKFFEQNKHKRRTSTPSAELEPAIPTIKRSQT